MILIWYLNIICCIDYVEAAERLQKESGNICSRFDAADNVDLPLIISEYEAYYVARFAKKPKLVRLLNDGEEPKKAKVSSSNNGSKATVPSSTKSERTKSKINDSTPEEGEEDLTNPNLPISLQGMCVTGMNAPVNSSLATVLNMKKGKKVEDEAADVDLVENRLLKPLPQYGGDKEMKTLCDVISREIYQESPNVR